MYNQGGLFKTFEQEYDADYNYKRFNYRANVDINLTRTTKLSANIAGSVDNVSRPLIGSTEALMKSIYAATPFSSPGILPKVSESSEAAEASFAMSTNSLDAPKAKIVEGVVDKNMLKNFEMIVAQHLSDPNFTIDSLAEMMHMGRTKLYGKIKELTGETPNKYIMRQRMTKAAELLLTGDYTVSDICYKLGLEDVSYFNKCFKSYYGVSPSKYGK